MNCDFKKENDRLVCSRCGFTLPVIDRQVLRNCGSSKQPELPSLASQAVHLVSDMAKWAVKGFPVVERDEKERRLGICQSCPLFTGARCSECGCQCAWSSWLETKECPKGKW